VIPRDAEFPEPPGNLPLHRRDPAASAIRFDEPAALLPLDAAPPPALTGGPDLAGLWRGIKRRWLTAFVLGGGLAVTAAVAAWFLLPARFTAFSQVKVAESVPSIGKTVNLGGTRAFATFFKTQANFLRSRKVINAALRNESVKQLNLFAKHDDPAAWLEEELKVESPDNSEIITLTFTGTDPTEAVTIVGAVTRAYMDEIVDADEKERRNQVSSQQKAHDDMVIYLNGKLTRLNQLSKEMEMNTRGAPTFNQINQISTLTDLQRERHSARMELNRLQGLLAAAEGRAKGEGEVLVTESVVSQALDADPSARQALAQMERLRELMARYETVRDYKNEPTYIRSVGQLESLEKLVARRRADLKKDLEDRARKEATEKGKMSVGDLKVAISSQKDYLAKLDEELKQASDKLAAIGRPNTEYDLVLREVDQGGKKVSELWDQLETSKMALRDQPRISVFQPADLQKKDAKKQILATALAPAATLIMVCAGLGWWEYRQRRVYSADQVSSGLGIRVVGAVPELPNLERRLIGPGGEFELEGHPVVESFDAIRTRLLRDGQAEAPRVVLVTSAGAAEGKTTLAAHLAGSLARAGRKTLLLDGDLRTPSVHQLFEVPLQPGFSEVLLAEVEPADAVQGTPLENLAVVPAGQWDREVMQALARDGVQGIFERFKEEFDFIVVDSHPVLAAADALLLGQQVDAVLLSVLRDVSRAPRVYAACQRLSALGVRLLGAVVNGTDPEEVVTGPATYALAGVR
jgi:capsular exopolysaccharide synthesis family protein